MKKISVLAMALTFVFALFALAGCGSDARQHSVGGSMDKTRVSFIDVGKGDCILLQSGGSVGLIDTGYEETSNEVISYLREQGVSRIDWLIITHYDSDHVGGLRAIGEAFGVDVVYLPGYEGSDKNYRTVTSAVEDLGLQARSVTNELHLELGVSDLAVFPSDVAYVPATKKEEGNDNDVSLVASLVGDGASYLFAGDLEKDGIEAYLSAGHGHFDVLKMPHHGRKSSNTDAFIEDVQPRIAIITDSADEPADKKTLKLLEKSDVEVYQTSESGTIVVQADDAGGYSVVE